MTYIFSNFSINYLIFEVVITHKMCIYEGLKQCTNSINSNFASPSNSALVNITYYTYRLEKPNSTLVCLKYNFSLTLNYLNLDKVSSIAANCQNTFELSMEGSTLSSRSMNILLRFVFIDLQNINETLLSFRRRTCVRLLIITYISVKIYTHNIHLHGYCFVNMDFVTD